MKKTENNVLIIIGITIFTILLIFNLFSLINQNKCRNQGGFYLETKKCYIPSSEEEKQQIIKQGYVKTEYDFDSLNWSEIENQQE